MQRATRCSTMAMIVVFYTQHMQEQASDLDGMPDPSVSLTPEFFANPRCPPSTSFAAPVPDPVAISREERQENSPTAVGEEATLPMGLPASSDGGVKDAAAN